jgi:hypothetical protein
MRYFERLEQERFLALKGLPEEPKAHQYLRQRFQLFGWGLTAWINLLEAERQKKIKWITVEYTVISEGMFAHEPPIDPELGKRAVQMFRERLEMNFATRPRVTNNDLYIFPRLTGFKR